MSLTHQDAPFPQGMLKSITDFFVNVHPTLTPGQDIYPEVFTSDLFFPLQRKGELAQMMRIARSIQPTVIMEIGCDKGGGLYHWCQCLPSVRAAIGFEIRGTPYSQLFFDAFNTQTRNVKFRWGTNSQSENQKLHLESVLSNTPIDCMFIDGNKTIFLRDFYTYLPLMNPNGIVFMHDINDLNSQPLNAFTTLSNRYDTEVIIDHTDTNLSLVRESQGISSSNPHEGWLRHWKGRSCGVGVIYLGNKP